MFSKFERFVAFRYLRSRRKEAFISFITVISIAGVAISVMVLNIVLAVMSGFEAELREKLIGATAHILVRDFSGDVHDWIPVREAIRQSKHVVEAFPYTYQQVLVSSEKGARGLLIRGVANERAALDKIEQYAESETKFSELFEDRKVPITRPDGEVDEVSFPKLIIGRELQRILDVHPGELVTIFAPKLNSTPQGLLPKQRRFLVVGTYHSGLVEYESGLAYTSIEDAQAFFNLGSAVTGIEVQVDEIFKAKEIAREIVDSITSQGRVFYATDWSEPHRPLWEAMKLEKRVYFIVLLLLILVASFSIVSTLVMVVMEKSKDIAILKTIGATNKNMLKIFLLQGSVIGMLGTVLGTTLGVLGSLFLREYGFEIDQKVFSLNTVPVHLISANFIVVAVVAFIITSLAGVYPALRAAKAEPAETLRFD